MRPPTLPSAPPVRPTAESQQPPPRPRKPDPHELGFRRRDPVRWIDPAQLFATGLRTAIAEVLGSYSDRREVQATRPPSIHDEYQASPEGEIWIDYVSDLGDGWNATYSIAHTASRESLEIGWKESTFATRRGRILVLGGDAVYPTPHRHEYRDRLEGPYTAALPYVAQEPYPHVFAIPGNHDWYDGLTGFGRLFFQGRWIGGRQTRQSRSYFSLRLPGGWWLWGVDFQLMSDIDRPQLEFFQSQADRLESGDRVILCAPEPTWVYCSTRGEETFQNLSYFERTILGPSRGELAVALAGDLHHYCRFERVGTEGPAQRITAGGGGAYLSPTYRMPEKLTLPVDGQANAMPTKPASRRVEYARKALYPEAGTSRGQRLGVLLFPLRHLGFIFFVGSLYLLLAWMLEVASPGLREELASSWQGGDVGHMLRAYQDAFSRSMGAVAFALFLVFGLKAWAGVEPLRPTFRSRWGPWIVGPLHALAHIGLAMAVLWLSTGWVSSHADVGRAWLIVLGVLVLGGLSGAWLVAFYLLLSNSIFRLHDNEVFSAQGIEDHKSFLRLHVDRDGGLTIYPIGLRRGARRWSFQPSGSPSEPWFTPDAPIKAELIEPPIRIASSRAARPSV